MGAVLGVAAWSRGQEKIAGASTLSTSIGSSSPIQQQTSFSSETTTDTITPVNTTKAQRPVVKKPVINSNPDSILERD
jgi:hypothetical protein